MYERFTDRARKAMQLAQAEAMQLNHEYIGTEHLLIGVCKVDGVAVNMLKELEANPYEVIKEVQKLVKPGPEITGLGKMPLTPNVIKAMEAANEEARKLQHNYVGDEHLLVGLFKIKGGVAHTVLKEQFGITLAKLQNYLVEVLGNDEPKSKVAEGTFKTYLEFRIPGTLETPAMLYRIPMVTDLPTDPAIGDLIYYVRNSSHSVMVFAGETWINAGTFDFID